MGRRGKIKRSLSGSMAGRQSAGVIKALVFFPLGIVLILSLLFFISDDFTLLFLVASRNAAENSRGEAGDYEVPGNWDIDWSVADSGSSDLGMGGGVTGQAGLNLMLMNKMTGGYCADWLTIAQAHVSGEKMNPNVKWLNGKHPSIAYVLGTAIKECDPQDFQVNGMTVKVPHSTVNIRDYTYGVKVNGSPMNLYTANTKWFATNGSQYQDPFFTKDFKRGGFWSTFQMTRDHLSQSPDSPNGTGGVRYASLLNGYGIETSIDRGKTDSDFGYFPDWVSGTIQSGWGRLEENSASIGGSLYNMDAKSIDGVGYAMTNAGQGNFPSWFGLGHSNVYGGDNFVKDEAHAQIPNLAQNRKDANAYTSKCTADAINQILAAADKCYNYIATHKANISEADFLNRTFFQGVEHGAVYFSCKDAFTNTANAPRFEAKLGNAAYCRGIELAYTACTGQAVLTTGEGVTEFRKMITNAKDPDGYELYNYKTTDTTNATVYFYDASGNTIDGTKPVIHAAVQEPTSGIFWVPVCGMFMYWKMLTYAGVECTFEDAMSIKYTGGPPIGASGGSYYWGTRRLGNFLSTAEGGVASNLPVQTSALYWRVYKSSVGVHYGEDYGGMPKGTPFCAVAAGTVAETRWYGTGGNMILVMVDTVDGDLPMSYRYLHLSGYIASEGDYVEQGQLIAKCGNTGGSYGNHMHINFIVYRNGVGSRYSGGYCTPYRALFEQRCAPYNAPGVIEGSKSSKGVVYGYDISKELGSLEDYADADGDNGISNNYLLNGYYTVGLPRFIDASVTQAASQVNLRGR